MPENSQLAKSSTQHKKNTVSENLQIQCFFMPVAGLEPARIAPHDFESCASANSATPATQYR